MAAAEVPKMMTSYSSNMAAADVPKKMTSLLKREEEASYILTTTEVPEPCDDEVLIRVDLVAICGSDIALYHWNDLAKAIATVPFIPGHECTGVVVKAGPTSNIKVGQRIAVENHYFCGTCFQCQNDRRDICQNLGQYGHGKKTMHGGCSQYSIVPSKYCYVLTTDISAEEAVLLEPLGVAHNAIEQLKVEGEAVLVIGAGPVGLLACSVAKALGSSRVICVDIDGERLKLASKMGADVTINSLHQDLKDIIKQETNGDGIGRICEMSGAEVMMNTMFTMLRKGGRVAMVGLPKTALHVENALQQIVFKSLTLKTIHGRRIFHTWKEIERLVSRGLIDVTPIVSHRLPMTKFEEAFSALFSGKACKIIMDPHN